MKRADIETRMQLTGRFLFQPEGTSGYINFGDLAGHKIDVKREGAPVEQSEKGFHWAMRNFTALVANLYEFTLREQTKINYGLLIRSGGVYLGDSQSQVVAPNGTASFNGVLQGKTYLIKTGAINKVALNTVVVTVSAVQKTEGVDYTIDLGSGELYIIPGGGIADGANVSLTFGQAAVDGFDYYQALWAPGDHNGAIIYPTLPVTGACRIFEFDQHAAAGVQRRLHTFTGQVWFEGDETHDGKKPAEKVLKVLAIDKPTVQILK